MRKSSTLDNFLAVLATALSLTYFSPQAVRKLVVSATLLMRGSTTSSLARSMAGESTVTDSGPVGSCRKPPASRHRLEETTQSHGFTITGSLMGSTSPRLKRSRDAETPYRTG